MFQQAANPNYYAFSVYSLPVLFAGLAISGLGLFIFMRERASRVGAAFLLVCLCPALFYLTEAANYASRDAGLALFWGRIGNLGALFVPSSVLFLTMVLFGLTYRYRAALITSLSFAILFAIGLFFPELFIRGVEHYFWGWYSLYGPLGYAFICYFSVIMAFILILYIREYSYCTTERRIKRYRGLLAALTCGCFGALDFFPALGISVYPFGYVPVCGCISICAYVIIRYNLVDITPEMAAAQILETMQGAVIVTGLDGRIKVINSVAVEMLGHPKSELLDRDLATILPLISEVSAVVRGGGRVLSREMTWEGKKERYVVSLSVSLLTERQNSEPIGIVYAAYNITDRKRNEEALQMHEERLRMALAASQQSWFDLNVQTGAVLVSPEYWRILGYEPEEFHASLQSWIDGLHPEDRDAVLKVFREAIDTGATKTMEYRRMAKDGSWTWIRSMGRIVGFDSNNKPLRMMGTHTDITKWKQTEKMLREAVITAQEEKTKSEAIVAALGDGLVILDTGFKVVYQNKVMREMLGDLVGKVCYQAGEGRDAVCENCPVERSFKDGLIHRVERARPTREGTVHLDITSSPLCDASGKVIEVIEVVRDVSEQKSAEEVLRRSHEELEILVNERTAELTMMNEQLRNLSVYLQNAREDERMKVARDIHDDLGQSLTAIKLGLASVKKKLPKDQRPIREQVEYVSALAEATMQSVKRISAELRPGILDHIGLDSAIEWHAAEFEKRNCIPCTVVFEPEEIHLDRDRSTAVFRIFQESLTNVTRHAKASKVEALLKLQAGELLLQVKDDGKGITEQQVSDGKSIGLIGMRERVHYWGGSFAIKGVPNKGTTVVVRIPIDTAGEALR